MEAIVKEIADSGVKLVVISGGSVSEMAVHFLEKYQLMCLKITSKWELRGCAGRPGCTALCCDWAPLRRKRWALFPRYPLRSSVEEP